MVVGGGRGAHMAAGGCVVRPPPPGLPIYWGGGQEGEGEGEAGGPHHPSKRIHLRVDRPTIRAQLKVSIPHPTPPFTALHHPPPPATLSLIHTALSRVTQNLSYQK